MRATDLGFRSPKEKTAEFNNPRVTFDGRVLPILHVKKHPTFSKSRRFSQYDIDARKTGPKAGPGAYKLIQEPGAEWRIKGTPLYRSLHSNKDTSDNGYIFVGHSMLYEPSFVLTRRDSQRNSSLNSFQSKDLARRSYSIKESDYSWRESEGKEKFEEKKREAGKITEQSETAREEIRHKTAKPRSRRQEKTSTQLIRNSPYATRKIKSTVLKFKEHQKRRQELLYNN